MSLINCQECNSKISDKAISCPKCGAPNKKKKSVSFLNIFNNQFFFLNKNISQFIKEIKLKNYSLTFAKKYFLSYFLLISIFTGSMLIVLNKDSKEKIIMSYEIADLIISSFNDYIYFPEYGKRKGYQFINASNYKNCFDDTILQKKYFIGKCRGLSYIKNNLKKFTFEKIDKNNDQKISRDELQYQIINNKSEFINNPKIKTKASELLKLRSNKYFLNYIETLDKFNKLNFKNRYQSGNIIYDYIHYMDLNRDFIVSKNEMITYEFYIHIMPLAEFINNGKLPDTTVRTFQSYINSYQKTIAQLEKKQLRSNQFKYYGNTQNKYNKDLFLSPEKTLISKAENIFQKARACYNSLPSSYKNSISKSYYDASKSLNDGKKYLTMNKQKWLGTSELKNSISYSEMVLQTGKAYGSTRCN